MTASQKIIFSSSLLLIIIGGTYWMYQPLIQNSTLTHDSLVMECEKKKVEYFDLMDKQEFAKASQIMSGCSSRLDSQEYRDLIAIAEIKSYEIVIHGKLTPSANRLDALNQLEANYPEEVKKYTKLKAQLESEVKNKKMLEAQAEIKKKKNEGVSIGMTKADVLASSWGKPQSINTTTNAYGVREQWVYGGRNYLYFKNGILESIQN